MEKTEHTADNQHLAKITTLENDVRREMEACNTGYILGNERKCGPLSRLVVRDALVACGLATTNTSWLSVVAIARLVLAHYSADLTIAEEAKVMEAYKDAQSPDGGAEGPVAAIHAEKHIRVSRWPWSQ